MLLFLFVYACSEEVDELKRQMQKIEIDLKKEVTEISYIFYFLFDVFYNEPKIERSFYSACQIVLEYENIEMSALPHGACNYWVNFAEAY